MLKGSSIVNWVSESYANVSRSWKNNWLIDGGQKVFHDNSTARTALYLSESRDADLPSIGFGFFTNQTSNSYVLALYVGASLNISDTSSSPVVVWCANRDHPVRDDATLQLTSEGDLVLRDFDGSYVWSTNTSGLSVLSINLLYTGLVLLNQKWEMIWYSNDYPTDTVWVELNYFSVDSYDLRLTSSISETNYSTGDFYVTRELDGFHAFLNLNPPQEYKFLDISTFDSIIDHISYNYFNWTFAYLLHLDQNGHLNLFTYRNQTENYASDLFEDDVLGDCAYPTTCGKYGVCINRGQCGCPAGNNSNLDYFKPDDAFNINSGCSLVTPLSCPDTNNLHNLLELPNVAYIFSPTYLGRDVESCKRECLNNCSCKAVFFRYYDDSSIGNCTLPSEILTLMEVSPGSMGYKAVAFIKVQNRLQNTTVTYRKSTLKRKLVPSVSASIVALVLVAGVCFYVLKQRTNRTKEIDDSLDVLVDTVSRFSFESLKLATLDFQTRLGRGGFGSVFEGTLVDGTKIAVKRLDSCGQGRKEFLAEVNSIGSLHHFNLVKLIGFCDDGMNRLLVYEYMCNGSLEKWIFNSDNKQQRLTWPVRRKIIEGIAIGLEYLHEHCKQNVIHFDIKPQNILLDKDFNVRISDFGLAKMVDRDQGQVLTMVRGTPGYMAPELIKGHAISVKVDVYSFGVVVLEIVCGRRNVGPLEGDCLTILVKEKADEDQLSDLVDEDAEDMQQHKLEAVNMMKIAIWCLQPHFIRPTMSKVVKILLQDLSNREALNDLNDLTLIHERAPVEATCNVSFHPSEVLLSGPR